MIKNSKDVQEFIIKLDTYETQQGVYGWCDETGKYGYRDRQDMSTSWYPLNDFFKVVWRDRKEINAAEKNETA